jgi:uncharacterized MAPEG superfamily protein
MILILSFTTIASLRGWVYPSSHDAASRGVRREAAFLKLGSELYSLVLVAFATALMWVPYMVARIRTLGLMQAVGNPDPSHAPDPAWAERAWRAHVNAIEYLAIFAPLVLITALAGVSTPATVLAAKTYLVARLVHHVVYAAGIPVVRTLTCAVGFVATLVFAITLLGHAG